MRRRLGGRTGLLIALRIAVLCSTAEAVAVLRLEVASLALRASTAR